MESTGDVSSYQNDSGMPTYVVYRDIRPGDPFDPTAPLHFLPPKDSDELFDALRFAFPHLSTHSERLRDATINFLLEEQQAYSTSAPPQPAMPPQASPQTRGTSQSSTSSATSSRLNVWNHSTVGTKGKFKHSRPSQASAQSSPLLTKDMPPQEDMTGVFSVSHVQPKQHQRRKMTEEEKADYRRRRMVKACDKCAKRKRKCIHNFLDRLSPQPEHGSSDSYGNRARSDVGSPSSSMESHNQTERDSSQEITNTYEHYSKNGSGANFTGIQSMEGVPCLPDAHIVNWDGLRLSDFTMDMIDPALGSAAPEIVTSGVGPKSQQMVPHVPLVTPDWTIDSADRGMQPILRTDECLQFEELALERWQLSWPQNQTNHHIPCGASHDYDEYVLPQDNEYISRPRTLLVDKKKTGILTTLPSMHAHPQLNRIYPREVVYDVQHDGHSSPLTYYGHALQNPEKDPKIAADDASSDGEPFDMHEIIMDGQMAAICFGHCKALNSVLAAWLRSVSTFASVLTLVMCLLRRGEKITALNGWPMEKWLQEMNDFKANDPLALRFQ